MKFDDNALHFFLGANTPQGFVSRFGQLASEDDGWRLYIIKGGPGSGKSTMLKKIAGFFNEHGEDIEIIHCSSDVDSLDGIICPGLKLSFADGTPPHSIDPKYPGAFESIIDITSCWDSDKLYSQREAIISLSKDCTKNHEHCCRFLGAVASLAGDTYRIVQDCLDERKLAGYCSRLVEKELTPVRGRNRRGVERIRMLSAVTNKGIVAFIDSAKKLSKRIYLINDDYGAVSRVILREIKDAALTAGYDIISSYCPLSPFDKLEHIFIPELEIGFMTSNSYHDFNDQTDPYRIINSRRFTDNEKLRSWKKRISFNRKAAVQMTNHAQSLLSDAKKLHDELEAIYTEATDFTRVDELTQKTLDKVNVLMTRRV